MGIPGAPLANGMASREAGRGICVRAGVVEMHA